VVDLSVRWKGGESSVEGIEFGFTGSGGP
jgi:hypothetical protein